jgi:hypothetical protein
MTGVGVIDIYAEAGMAKPDLSLIDGSVVDQAIRPAKSAVQDAPAAC